MELPQTMQRAMAKQAEAEREKRAKVLLAQGEYPGGADAGRRRRADLDGAGRLQLRYLQTLTEIAVEKNSTIVFPLPIDLLEPLSESARTAGHHGTDSANDARAADHAAAADAASVVIHNTGFMVWQCPLHQREGGIFARSDVGEKKTI